MHTSKCIHFHLSFLKKISQVYRMDPCQLDNPYSMIKLHGQLGHELGRCLFKHQSSVSYSYQEQKTVRQKITCHSGKKVCCFRPTPGSKLCKLLDKMLTQRTNLQQPSLFLLIRGISKIINLTYMLCERVYYAVEVYIDDVSFQVLSVDN